MTNEGIDFLRQYLHLPTEIVPSTLKRTARSDTARPRATGPRGDGPKSGEDRQAYRRVPGQGGDKKADVGAGAADLELVSLKFYFIFTNNKYIFFTARWIWPRKQTSISDIRNCI